jgi:hypothetical protein
MRIFKICGCFLLISTTLLGQNFNKTDFYEADMALLSGDYVSAQTIYTRLLKSEPENANLNFLNGLCLLNIQGRKKESYAYLKKAVPSANVDYKYGDPKETNAPIEVIKYYAMACKLNNEIPTAINLLNQYKSLLNPKEKEEFELTDALIESCYYAQKMQSNPVYCKSNPVESFTTEESELYPVVSNDETMLFYSVRGKYGKDDIFFAKKVNGAWTSPEKITTVLGVKSECYPSSISADNQRLYLTVKIGVSTDIYYSEYSNNRWQKMIKMDKPVNGNSWDSQASESSDGRFLYFSSDRKGGYGEMDLYFSEKNEKGAWKKPINLGEIINTRYNELMPLLRNNDTRLYFKSEGHDNMGGYDIFYSDRSGISDWSPPVNLGYPLNTTDDDIYFIPMNDVNFAYAARLNPDNGEFNLYHIEIFSETHTRQYIVSGQIMLPDQLTDFSDVSIEVYSTTTYQKILTLQPEAYTGKYQFEIKNGNYMINFNKPGYELYTHLIDLPVDLDETHVIINPSLKSLAPPVTMFVPESQTEEEPVPVQPENKNQPDKTVVTPTIVEYTNEYTQLDQADGIYTIQIMALKNPTDISKLQKHLPDIRVSYGDDGFYRYTTGTFNTLYKARDGLKSVLDKGYKGAFVKEISKIPNYY